MPTSWRSAPITGKLQAFRLTINWRTRVNGAVGSTCTTHFRHRAFHHVIVVRHHLTGGEGECSQKIEFGHDTQHLSFLYDWEGIEIMLLEQRFQISKSDVARHGRDVARVMYWPAVHSINRYIAPPGSLSAYLEFGCWYGEIIFQSFAVVNARTGNRPDFPPTSRG